ncbi:hypothetical protein TI04_02090 [Achromatium sp. WMS2]|nr:hypothetical protein TI04_02090 [Achromatium sp. WMS2]
MLVRCPTCEIIFRVNTQQLQVAAGQVRCGHCMQIFNAQTNPLILGPAPLVPSIAVAPRIPQAVPPKSNLSLWNASVILLILALLVQLVWWQRIYLVRQPIVGPILASLCQQGKCGLEQFRDLDRIEILERSLERSDIRPELMIFRLRMLNRAYQSQVLPLIEVKLLDNKGAVLGLRRFTPQQYLPIGTPDRALMSTGKIVTAKLALLDSTQKVTGFQIEFR